MATIHNATLNPSKLTLLNAWLPSRTWFTGVADVQRVGAYRFDDPAGEVGIESFLLQAGDGSVLHAPLTYRGAPLAGAEEFLVGTIEHSVLGRRWNSEQSPPSARQSDNHRAGNAGVATARPRARRRCRRQGSRRSCRRSCRGGRWNSSTWDCDARGSGAAGAGQQQQDRGAT
jgi:Maltokinase N-terminal cap domain